MKHAEAELLEPVHSRGVHARLIGSGACLQIAVPVANLREVHAGIASCAGLELVKEVCHHLWNSIVRSGSDSWADTFSMVNKTAIYFSRALLACRAGTACPFPTQLHATAAARLQEAAPGLAVECPLVQRLGAVQRAAAPSCDVRSLAPALQAYPTVL